MKKVMKALELALKHLDVVGKLISYFSDKRLEQII